MKMNVCFFISAIANNVVDLFSNMFSDTDAEARAKEESKNKILESKMMLNDVKSMKPTSHDINSTEDIIKMYDNINNNAKEFNDSINRERMFNHETLNINRDPRFESNFLSLGGLIGSLIHGDDSKIISRAGIDESNKILKGAEDYYNNVFLTQQKEVAENDVKRFNMVKGMQERASLYSKGGSINGINNTSELVTLDGGYKHGQGAYSGIPIGIGPDGEQNVAERGEAIHEDYVFSDSIIADKKAIEKYGFPKKWKDKTIAECAKMAAKESDERGPADEISKNTMKNYLYKLKAYNEEKLLEKQLMEQLEHVRNNRMDIIQEENAKNKLKLQQAMQNEQYVPQEYPDTIFSKCGGKINKFKKGGPLDGIYSFSVNEKLDKGMDDSFTSDIPYIKRLKINIADEFNKNKIGNPKSIKSDKKDSTKKRKQWLKSLDEEDMSDDKIKEGVKLAKEKNAEDRDEKLQKLGLALNAGSAILGPIVGIASSKKPDYSYADAIKNSISLPEKIANNKPMLSDFEVYKPRYTDINYFTNLLRNDYAANIEMARNAYRSPGEFLAIAENANRSLQNAIGDAMLKGYERNDEENWKRFKSYNDAQEKKNAYALQLYGIENDINKYQASLMNDYYRNNLTANIATSNMYKELDDAYSNSLSTNLNNLFTGLGNLGSLLYGAKSARTEDYSGATQRKTKYGGKIKRKTTQNK